MNRINLKLKRFHRKLFIRIYSTNSPTTSSTTNHLQTLTKLINRINIADKINSTQEIIKKSNVIIKHIQKTLEVTTTSINQELIVEKQIKRIPTSTIILPKNVISNQTRHLCKLIKNSSSILIKNYYLEQLNKHLYEFSDTRHFLNEENLIKHLKHLKKQNPLDKRLIGNINECFALSGTINSTKRRGINVLTLDGGGAKGLVSIELLKQIVKKCDNRPIHELFDFICGTSTGAVLACLLGVYKIPLDDCEKYYKAFLQKIFERNLASGLGNLLMSQAYYDTKCWETMLKEAMGDKLLIQSARDETTPKIAVVSNLLTPNQMKVFLFRNYNLPNNNQSHYDGTHKYQVWQALRASSAAPGYYEEIKIGGYIFHDGGVIANNPSGIALHECKLLWPNTELNCVISIGTGRFQPAEQIAKCDSLTFKQKLGRIVDGATSTESK
jgi:calcium-independent phospholipase A2-gamma